MLGYNEIKRLAKEVSIPVTELLALSPKNDPFYAGTPAARRDAEWFAEIWQRAGYDRTGAPEGYFDLRVAELRETYAGSGNLGSLIWDDVKQDINDVKLRRTTWEQIMARLQPAQEEVDGG